MSIPAPPSPRVRPGLDLLLEERFELVAGRRVALLVNPTSVRADLTHSVDAFLARKDVTVGAIFAPEHGLAASAQDMEHVGEEAWLGIPVRSLYGADEASLAPRAEWLQGIDAIVYDIQDVGSRYYTFLATLSYAMEVARDAGVEVIVADRPNPIGATAVEGGTVRHAFRSFVGRFALCARHGMTSGEVALLMNRTIGCRLTVVPMQGYARSMWFEATALPWVSPSPNMPTIETAAVYPGACLVEGTNLSEGRGTTRPFETIGAPWVDGPALARELHTLGLPGVRFRPCTFMPKHQKWRDQPCRGVQIHVLDRSCFKPLLTGVAVIRACAEMWPMVFAWRREPYEFVRDRLAIDLLAGNDVLRGQIERGDALEVIERSWEPERKAFLAEREKSLLYPEPAAEATP